MANIRIVDFQNISITPQKSNHIPPAKAPNLSLVGGLEVSGVGCGCKFRAEEFCVGWLPLSWPKSNELLLIGILSVDAWLL